MEAEEIEKKLSFTLRERSAKYEGTAPQEYSGIAVVNGHQMVLSNSRVFLDGEKVEDDVVYISRGLNKVAATKTHEVVIFDFDASVIRRIEVGSSNINRCEVLNEYLGVLFDDGVLKIFKDGRLVTDAKDVKDFSLPDSIVGKNGEFGGQKDVERIFGCLGHKDEFIVTRERLVLGSSVVENPLHKGDFEYDKNIPPHYYFSSFQGIHLLVSSNCSRFLLFGRELRELELEEEIKVLGLRTDEGFNVAYLTGLDYSDGVVYLLDEGGAVSEFKVCGLGDLSPPEVTPVEFKEEKYIIVKDDIRKVEDVGGRTIGNGESGVRKDLTTRKDSGNGGKREGLESSLGELLKEVENYEDNSREGTISNRDDGVNGRTGGIKTGDPKVDALLEDIALQTDSIINDFREIKVEKKVFQMYRHNTNDLSLFTEQTYKNIMVLENHKDIKDEMISRLTCMLGNLEIYSGMDEENVKSAIRRIDAAIGSMCGHGRKAVHYTKPLFYSANKVRGIDIGLGTEDMKPRKTLAGVDYVERRLDESNIDDDLLRLGIKDSRGHGSGLSTDTGEKVDVPSGPELREVKSDVNNMDAPLGIGETTGHGQDIPNVADTAKGTFVPAAPQENLARMDFVSSPQTNIFGQPVSQQEPAQFGGVFQGSTPSNIFQSIASNSPILPHPQPREEEEDRSTPSAFSRFASSRNLFK